MHQMMSFCCRNSILGKRSQTQLEALKTLISSHSYCNCKSQMQLDYLLRSSLLESLYFARLFSPTLIRRSLSTHFLKKRDMVSLCVIQVISLASSYRYIC